MDEIVVTKEGVTKLLQGLNPSKALGPDGLHPRVLKELAKELGPVFAHLLINMDEIPKEWSLANICPLFKKGDMSLARFPPSFFDLYYLQTSRTYCLLKNHGSF